MNTKGPVDFKLRPLAGSDIDLMAVWFADLDDLALFDRSAPIPVGPEAVRKMWLDDIDGPAPRKSYWFVAESADGDALGVCGLQGINYVHGDATIPLFIAREVRGRGIGMEMAARVLDLGFDRLRLRRISTFYREDNAATRTMVGRLGFTEEGRMRQAWFSEGRHLDVITAGLLAEEWRAVRSDMQGRHAASGGSPPVVARTA